jgi:hypothetical protein
MVPFHLLMAAHDAVRIQEGDPRKRFRRKPHSSQYALARAQKLFAEPLASQTGSSSNLMTVGVNHDTLLTGGWLELSKGPLVLHVPDMNDRYYSMQFTDPSKNTNFAYVGKRTTGTHAGAYLITGPGWKGQVPSGMKQISSPNRSVLLLGRVLVESDSDLSTAYGLSKQVQLTPLNHWQPGQ